MKPADSMLFWSLVCTVEHRTVSWRVHVLRLYSCTYLIFFYAKKKYLIFFYAKKREKYTQKSKYWIWLVAGCSMRTGTG